MQKQHTHPLLHQPPTQVAQTAAWTARKAVARKEVRTVAGALRMSAAARAEIVGTALQALRQDPALRLIPTPPQIPRPDGTASLSAAA